MAGICINTEAGYRRLGGDFKPTFETISDEPRARFDENEGANTRMAHRGKINAIANKAMDAMESRHKAEGVIGYFINPPKRGQGPITVMVLPKRRRPA